MYKNNLKILREEKDYTQSDISKMLNVNRSTYNNWERGVVMIPIEIVDTLSTFYKVKISYILGIDNNLVYYENIEKMDYSVLINNLIELKNNHKNTYSEIASFLNCNLSTCQRYYKYAFKIPIDRLILLSQLYNVDIDTLCGK